MAGLETERGGIEGRGTGRTLWAAGDIRVLYIDDDAGIARLVQRRLRSIGFVVTLAADGAAGLDCARAGTFDAIALDHYMPGRDGLEVLGELRAVPDAPPVIFVTSAEEPRIAIAALKAGADDYVVKDVQGTFLDLLGPTLEQAVERSRLRRAREAAEREVRESRDRLERLTQQQALLLREVNHRVANSLQLISSLIELQARRVGAGEARESLHRAAERVEAVALVHRRLYTGNDVEFVDMDQYLAGLIDEFRRAVQSEDGLHRIELSTQPIRIEPDKAVSIGLIVNELVTNAVKYAYPRGVQGAVRVSLARAGCVPAKTGEAAAQRAATVTLVVEDDGVGYPPAGAPPKGSGVGAMIVQAMARTLHAKVTLDRSRPGTRFVVETGE